MRVFHAHRQSVPREIHYHIGRQIKGDSVLGLWYSFLFFHPVPHLLSKLLGMLLFFEEYLTVTDPAKAEWFVTSS